MPAFGPFWDELREALKPGATPWLITVGRITIMLVFVYAFIAMYIDFNIHYVILSIIALCLFLSFEYSVYYMKKDPTFFHEGAIKTETKRD